MNQINEEEFYELIERAIDAAVKPDGKFLFKVYPYLKAGKWTRPSVDLSLIHISEPTRP